MDSSGPPAKSQENDIHHGPDEQKLARHPGGSKRDAIMNSDNENEVRLPSADERSDPDIARDAAVAIGNQLLISSEHINVVVVNGWATLEGHVEWQYQKDTAESKLRGLTGVHGVVNNIILEPEFSVVEIKRKIEDELGKAAEFEASRNGVDPKESEVASGGTVRSWAEHQETEQYASAASGITKVEDQFS
jgi:osmotically-inducible protein OsmY